MNGPISIAWNSHKSDIVPADASDAQIIETKLAFYAGAVCTLANVIVAVEDGDAGAVVKAMSTELVLFMNEQEVQH